MLKPLNFMDQGPPAVWLLVSNTEALFSIPKVPLACSLAVHSTGAQSHAVSEWPQETRVKAAFK